nr:MAG TPA: hypothetical protein [Caudoviricetes sp.]
MRLSRRPHDVPSAPPPPRPHPPLCPSDTALTTLS